MWSTIVFGAVALAAAFHLGVRVAQVNREGGGGRVPPRNVARFWWNGVELRRDDFGDDLRSEVAYRIGYAAVTRCLDKSDAVGVLNATADAVMQRVREAGS